MNSILSQLKNKLSFKPILPQISSNIRYLSSKKSYENDSDFAHFLIFFKFITRIEFFFHSDSDNLYQMNRHFEELSVDSFKGLIKDKNTKQRIELILSEYEYEKYSTLRVTTNITEQQMKDLISLGDSKERKRWISYLFQREITKNKDIAERKKASEEYWIKRNKKYETINSK